MSDDDVRTVERADFSLAMQQRHMETSISILSRDD